LTMRWEADADMLRILWEERDGPLVERPASRGFGTRSVIASIESQLGGQAQFDWRAEGLVCRLSVPLCQGGLVRQDGNRQSPSIDVHELTPIPARA